MPISSMMESEGCKGGGNGKDENEARTKRGRGRKVRVRGERRCPSVARTECLMSPMLLPKLRGMGKGEEDGTLELCSRYRYGTDM